MPVPKRKRSRARRDSRFANKGIKIKSITQCRNCSEPTALVPHTACMKCGYYKGVKVLTTKEERSQKRAELSAARGEKRKAKAPEAPAE